MDQDVWSRDDGSLAQAARLVVVAVASALLTATLVIVVGQSLIERANPTPQASDQASDTVLIRTSD